MTIEVSKDEKILGTVAFTADHRPKFVGERDAAFEVFVAASLRDGIRSVLDFKTDGGYTLAEGPVSLSDPNYPLAFISWLRAEGFLVRVLHPEVDAEIRQLLAFAEDAPEKEQILETLPTLSYRDQTLILEVLRSSAQQSVKE